MAPDISIEKIIKDASRIHFSDEDKISFVSYVEFLKFFSDKKTITKTDFIIGTHFAYAWMPTILTYGKNSSEKEYKECAIKLDMVKKGKLLSKRDLRLLVKVVHNSMVGVSKILHFVSPETYPIIDSKVMRYFSGKNDTITIDTYLNYLAWCKKIVTNSGFNKIKNMIEKKVGYKISDLRALELVMYKASTPAIAKKASRKITISINQSFTDATNTREKG